MTNTLTENVGPAVQTGWDVTGIDFGVIDRQLAVAGQLIRLSGADGPVDDIFLPLYGAHQAANAAQALAATEAFLGLKALQPDVVREGFAQVRFPGRLELVRRSPAVVLDAAHNPHGARAAAAAITEAFAFTPLIGVVAISASATFVASQAPPKPTSTIATSTGASANAA